MTYKDKGPGMGFIIWAAPSPIAGASRKGDKPCTEAQCKWVLVTCPAPWDGFFWPIPGGSVYPCSPWLHRRPSQELLQLGDPHWLSPRLKQTTKVWKQTAATKKLRKDYWKDYGKGENLQAAGPSVTRSTLFSSPLRVSQSEPNAE